MEKCDQKLSDVLLDSPAGKPVNMKNGWMNAVWAGDPLAFTGAPEGYYVPYVEIACDWDDWIDSYWTDEINSEIPATETGDCTFGSTDEEETFNNSEIGHGNGRDHHVDPFAIHRTPLWFYNPYSELKKYKESICAQSEDFEESASAKNKPSTDCDNGLQEGCVLAADSPLRRSPDVLRLGIWKESLLLNMRRYGDNGLPVDPLAIYRAPKKLYKSQQGFQIDEAILNCFYARMISGLASRDKKCRDRRSRS
ncbi:hypothetical protein ScPMuIL_010931 [Solemya velum]